MVVNKKSNRLSIGDFPHLLEMNDASPPITKDHLDESERLGSDKVEPIAVIGFSLRLPQDATSPDKFWQLLMEARSAMTEVPEDRYNLDAFYHPDESRANAVHPLNCFAVLNLTYNNSLMLEEPISSVTTLAHLMHHSSQ